MNCTFDKTNKRILNKMIINKLNKEYILNNIKNACESNNLLAYKKSNCNENTDIQKLFKKKISLSSMLNIKNNALS